MLAQTEAFICEQNGEREYLCASSVGGLICFHKVVLTQDEGRYNTIFAPHAVPRVHASYGCLSNIIRAGGGKNHMNVIIKRNKKSWGFNVGCWVSVK